MPYVDLFHNRHTDIIHIAERVDGKRVFKEIPAEYRFYYDDPKGKYRSVFDTPLSKFSTLSKKEFFKEIKMMGDKQIWESDVKPIFRCLEDNYKGCVSPKLQTAFFDIEANFSPTDGYADPSDPFNNVTAVSVYLDWIGEMFTFALPPPTLTMEQATEACSRFPNTILFEDERDMLDAFLVTIEDADILSGWNSEGYDIPYLVNRITRIMSSDDTRRFCLWDQKPTPRDFERYGKVQSTYDTIGRVHLDYMNLYRKYTFEERHSYSLDAIGEYELNEKKVEYDGTLDKLYKEDFEKFIDYSRQDVFLIHKLDKKLKFLDLANSIAHDTLVTLPTTKGSIALIEQSIICESHDRGMIVQDRKKSSLDFILDTSNQDDIDDIWIEKDDFDITGKAAGAYVVEPKRGMHSYIGTIDINSLYPSTIRSLNMSPETIIGQVLPIMTDKLIVDRMRNGMKFAQAWDGLFGSLEYTAIMNKEKDTEVTIAWENGVTESYTAADVYNFIFSEKSKLVITANGTIFTYEREGIIPGILRRWYEERKIYQAKAEAADKAGDDVLSELFDKKQHVAKIVLNSAYGALLAEHCRFFDKRIGQSTTLSGRVIAKHMDAKANEAITGVYDYYGDAIIGGDTDSVFFTAWPTIKDMVERGEMEWNKDICIQMYNEVGNIVNESFPKMMRDSFHCTLEAGATIRGKREVVASTALIVKKKRYAMMMIDKEGKRYDVDGKPGKIKAMGLDLKRADTPKLVQKFLLDILTDLLTGHHKDDIIKKIKDFKYEFRDLMPWEKGTPKRVNRLTYYGNRHRNKVKGMIPGHVMASLTWNEMTDLYDDKYSTEITDGMKIIVCDLKVNPMGYKAVAYPIDQHKIPEWFKKLPFDNEGMMAAIVDKKVDNLLGQLNWNLKEATDIYSTVNSLFKFG